MRSSMGRRLPTTRVVLCFLGTCLLLGCAQSVNRIILRAAGQEITVEVARTEAEREHGLMGRKSLGPREGMIFLFDRDQHLDFWMKDTPLPLTIAFLSVEGKVLELEDMEPLSEKIIHSRLSARYALEMRKGAFADLGITEGMTIGFPPGFPDQS
jgi:uncharacterized membrane protein (UPF0127 family)